MNVKEAFGLGPRTERSGTVVPLATWVPAAIVLVALAVAVLLLAGVPGAWAVPAGIVAGLLVAIPLSAAITMRRSGRAGH